MNKLELLDLCKTYDKNKYALVDFSYEFTNGVYGLLGPNGAGKSTLMNIITFNIKCSSGKIKYNDKAVEDIGREYLHKIGYMPQSQKVYPGFSLERFLYYMAALKGISKKKAKEQIPELIELVNLTDSTHKKLGQFSGGMRQRALLAQALLGDPEILILDEPTAGLDPKERIRIRNIISQIALDKIVIIATHVVQDVEMIAKKILVMNGGNLIRVDDSELLCDEINGKVFEISCGKDELSEVSKCYKVCNITKKAELLKVRIIAEEAPQNYDHKAVEPNLEDVYLFYFSEIM